MRPQVKIIVTLLAVLAVLAALPLGKGDELESFNFVACTPRPFNSLHFSGSLVC